MGFNVADAGFGGCRAMSCQASAALAWLDVQAGRPAMKMPEIIALGTWRNVASVPQFRPETAPGSAFVVLRRIYPPMGKRVSL